MTSLPDLSAPDQLRSWRIRIFAITWLAYAAFYLCRKNFSVLMPLLQDHLGFSKDQLADIIFGYSLSYALGQVFAGSLSDRFSPRLIVTAGLGIAILSNLGMGFSTSFYLLGFLGCLNGLGQSQGWPGLVKTMACWFHPRERGVVMAWWTTNYVLGGFVGTVFATFVVSHPTFLAQWVWQRGFWAPAVLLSVIAVFFPLVARTQPSDVGMPDVAGDPGSKLIHLRKFLTKPVVWITGITAALLKITRYSFLFWLPLYMVEHLGYELESAGYISSTYELVGCLGAILAGYASDKLFQSRRYPVATIMQGGLGLACYLHPRLASQGYLGNTVGISLIGIMNYGPDTLMQGAASQDAGSRRGTATVAGFISGLSSIGQLVSPYLVARVTTRFGWDRLFQVFFVLSILGSLLTATMWNYTAAKPEGPSPDRSDGE